MASTVPHRLQEVSFEREAQAYLRSLPLEHFMEALDQATQREITIESLALVRASRKDVHVFNEMLIQTRVGRQRRLVQVCPDNMVVVSKKPIHATSSYNVPLEPEGPLWVMEYVSKNNPRKDYEDSLRKHERDLKVRYYLIFYPDTQDLTLYRHNGRRYVSVKPNERVRYAIPDLDIELALVDGWVRFWYRGDLLPLPADLQRLVEAAQARAAEAEQRAAVADQRATVADHRAAAAERQAAELARQLSELRARLGNGNKQRS